MSTEDTDSEIEQIFRDAQILADRGELEKARMLYASILRRAPDSARALTLHGLMLMQLDQDEDAFAEFQKALSIDPNFGLAHFGRGWVRGERGDAKGELADALRGLELDPRNAHMYFRRMGAAYDRMKKHVEAQAYFTKAIELKPGIRGAYFNRGLSYEESGDFVRALADLDRAIDLDPDWPWGLVARGRLYGKLGKPGLALTDFALALKFNPKYAEAYKDRGALYEQLGEKALALADTEMAMSLEKSPEVLKDLRARMKRLKSKRWNILKRG